MVAVVRGNKPDGRIGSPPMSMLEFYDYLVSSDATHDLALSLVDIWADRELRVLEHA